MPLQSTSKYIDEVELDMTLPATSGSPFRVYLRDREVVGLPTATTQVQLLSMSGSDSRGGDMEGPMWKELPTLASAIHISDTAPPPPTSLTFGPSQPLPKSTSIPPPAAPPLPPKQPNREDSIVDLPATALNTSSFILDRSKTLRRTSSKSSTSGSIGGESKPPENTLRRKLSRRLSIDNILQTFNGGMRRKDRVVSATEIKDGSLDDTETLHRWSMVENYDRSQTETNSPIKRPIAPKASRMALPPMRGLRSKFAVASGGGGGSGVGVLAAAKADVKARRERRDEVEMGSISSRGGMSITSDVDGTAGKKEKVVSRKALPDWGVETLGELNNANLG
jgi:hypothetical protein